MPKKYKAYMIEEDGKTVHEEFYSKKELNKHKIDPDEDIDLFEWHEESKIKVLDWCPCR